jgi:sugar lactone lactonase YvrE
LRARRNPAGSQLSPRMCRYLRSRRRLRNMPTKPGANGRRNTQYGGEIVKLRNLVLPVALLAAFAAFGGIGAYAQEGGPPPTSGVVLTSVQGILGATIGPDGALYVGQGGTGGSKEVTTPDGPGFFGLSGSIARIDPVTGDSTTVASNIASGAESNGGDGFGIADVAFLDGSLYYLTSGSFNLIEGLEAYPNGIYKVSKDGKSSELVADLSAFNDAHPVEFPDAGPGGNPFGLAVVNDEFYVTDGNYNRVLHATIDGKINIVSSFENVVTTGITGRDNGPLIITEFGAFPFDPASGKVIQVGNPTGTQIELASGYSHLISAAYGPDGNLYALSFGDQAPPESGDEAVPFSGKILRVNSDGTLTPIVDGLMFGTSLDFSGDIAYVSSLVGMVYQVSGFSALPDLPVAEPTVAPPPPPAPSPTPRTGIGAPDTGSGPAGDSDTTLWVLALAAAALGAVSVAGGLATKRR